MFGSDVRSVADGPSGRFGSPVELRMTNDCRVASLPRGAFRECGRLRVAHLSRHVAQLGDHFGPGVFADCRRLQSVEMPGVEVIGTGCFQQHPTVGNVALFWLVLFLYLIGVGLSPACFRPDGRV
jgi:hypothetical protein